MSFIEGIGWGVRGEGHLSRFGVLGRFKAFRSSKLAGGGWGGGGGVGCRGRGGGDALFWLGQKNIPGVAALHP